MPQEPPSEVADESQAADEIQGDSKQGFVLFDDQGRVVESGKVYGLELVVRDLENDGLSFTYTDQLHGAVDCGDLLVSCETIGGIFYLKYEDKYLYASTANDEIGLKVDVPERDERLRVLKLDNNAFQISMWDQELYASLEWIKCSYGAVWFKKERGMKLLLSRRDS